MTTTQHTTLYDLGLATIAHYTVGDQTFAPNEYLAALTARRQGLPMREHHHCKCGATHELDAAEWRRVQL